MLRQPPLVHSVIQMRGRWESVARENAQLRREIARLRAENQRLIGRVRDCVGAASPEPGRASG